MSEMKPVVYDLCCGLGGFTEGFLAEGYRCIGFDIEAHEYGDHKYPGELRLKSILDLHGSELADAAVIVASPPCQEYSYMAMPWRRGKQIAAALRGRGEFPQHYTGSRTVAELRALFDACFRIQREASEAAGRHIPLVVENVKGAEPWVGRAAWCFGSFYLWGDVPALMPLVFRAQKFNPDGTAHPPGSWFAIADSKNRGAKNPGFNFHQHERTGQPGGSFQSAAVKNCTGLSHDMGLKGIDGKSWIRDRTKDPRPSHGNSQSRKAASALIAKIPFDLSNHIARVYRPRYAYELPA